MGNLTFFYEGKHIGLKHNVDKVESHACSQTECENTFFSLPDPYEEIQDSKYTITSSGLRLPETLRFYRVFTLPLAPTPPTHPF